MGHDAGKGAQAGGTSMKRGATIDDVARRAELSIKTVSRVLNAEPNVRPQTRERVLAAVRELEYQPNVSARRLASKRSFVIGLLYPTTESDYVLAIQDGCLGVCRERGYHLLIHPCRVHAPEFVEDITSLYLRSTVDGLALIPPVSDDVTLVAALLGAGIPFVRISQREVAGESPCISVDDEEAARRMTDHLIALGHTHIGFIMGHPEHGSSHDRLAGFRRSLDTHGIPSDQAPVEQGLFTFESGYSCAMRLLATDPRPTAIFASDDDMAMGVLSAAYERKLVVPADLSVCGFDDTPTARYTCPPLTTVRQPIKEAARLATEILLDSLDGKSKSERRFVLESKLVLRESTGHSRLARSGRVMPMRY